VLSVFVGSSGISGDHLPRETGTYVLTGRKTFAAKTRSRERSTKVPLLARCDLISLITQIPQRTL